jgi:formate hydrogenlyase subunit 3/multisubunit Na+/H+ antiporter MnhD subunit
MVNPLYFFAASMVAAFLLPLADKLGRRLSLFILYAVTAAWAAAGASWLLALLPGGIQGVLHGGMQAAMHSGAAVDFGTAGFGAPLAIVLRVGLVEAAAVLAIGFTGLLSAAAMHRDLAKAPLGGSMAFIMAVMGMSGIVLTRDLFNLFVFLEISAIATYGLIGFDDRRPALRSAFKYMMAGGIASALYLIGVIYVYRFGDTLNLDIAAASVAASAAAGLGSAAGLSSAVGLSSAAGSAAIFFLLAALLVELKPFPANGWGIDVYETANPGVSALLSGASATALVVALWKLLPILGNAHLAIVAGSGLATFAAANLAGARQEGTRRMLGYSSAAQIGLVTAVVALIKLLNLGDSGFMLMVAGGLTLNHLLAKTGLFLLSGMLGEDDHKAIVSPLTLAVAGMLALGLVGLPPFPGFWAKWQLVQALAAGGHFWIIVIVLGGSLVEAFYIFRWLGRLAKSRQAATDPLDASLADAGLSGPDHLKAGGKLSGPVLAALALAGFGVLAGLNALAGLDALAGAGGSVAAGYLHWAPYLAVALLFLVDRVPGWIKAILSLAAIAAFGWLAWPGLDALRQFFALMLLGGGALYVVAALRKGGCRPGLYPLMTMVTLSLGSVLVARSSLGFFFAWETMTLSSWLLVLRGRRAEKPALAYIVFGLGGAFILMTGLATGGLTAGAAAWPFVLVLVGILVKAGVLGLHVWLPGSYAEADDEVSGLLSASLSKVAIFALFALVLGSGVPGALALGPWAWRVLGWVGLGTAMVGALYAIYQEDIKLTLAWSSMGQIGYVVLAFAVMDHAGWTTALYLALNHFLYKSMLFLAIAGVVQRIGTRNMYEMGGLIKKMPLSFLSVLMAIIALSGVPPLSGFGGKWLLYSTLIHKGWYLEAAAAFFASGVAFLYLYRLIHSIFLGQPKPEHKAVREAPLALILPQLGLMAVLMAVSVFPSLMLNPIMALAGKSFQPIFRFDGSALQSPLGYWDGTLTMVVTGVVFALCLVWMLVNLHNPQSVKQFNIVYAAERPLRPNTTHYAWAFFEPYRDALGFLTRSRAEHFWATFGTGINGLGGALRRLYTGNGQTYALHVVIYVVALYFFMGAF